MQELLTEQPSAPSSYEPSARLPFAQYEELSQNWAISPDEMDRIAAERQRMN